MTTNPEKETRIFYFSAFLSYLMNGIIGPLYIVYLLSIHINIAQIGLILAAQSIATLLFEFITGIFADNYGRRKSLLVSYGLATALSVAWFFSRSFNIIILLAIIGGIAYTFQSGARDSMMIDNLGLEKNHSLRDKIFSQLSVFGNTGFLLGGLIAAGLAFYSIKTIWLASAVLNTALFITYLFLIKEKISQEASPVLSEHALAKMAKGAIITLGQIFKSRTILIMILVSVMFSLAIGSYGLAYPVYFKEIIKIPNFYFGILGSLSALMGIIGALIGERLIKKRGYYFTISFFALTLSLLYIVFGLVSLIWLTLAVFALIELFINGWYPPFQSFFNKFIPSKIRAGVLSFNSSIVLIAIALGNIMFGYLLKIIKPNILVIYSGAVFFVIFVLILVIKSIETKQSLEKKEAAPSLS